VDAYGSDEGAGVEVEVYSLSELELKVPKYGTSEMMARMDRTKSAPGIICRRG
jgi:hypothetical protein